MAVIIAGQWYVIMALLNRLLKRNGVPALTPVVAEKSTPETEPVKRQPAFRVRLDQ